MSSELVRFYREHIEKDLYQFPVLSMLIAMFILYVLGGIAFYICVDFNHPPPWYAMILLNMVFGVIIAVLCGFVGGTIINLYKEISLVYKKYKKFSSDRDD